MNFENQEKAVFALGAAVLVIFTFHWVRAKILPLIAVKLLKRGQVKWAMRLKKWY